MRHSGSYWAASCLAMLVAGCALGDNGGKTEELAPPSYPALTCICTVENATSERATVRAYLKNVSSVPVNLGPGVRMVDFKQLCQVLVRIDGQARQPSSSIQDVWPLAKQIKVFDLRPAPLVIVGPGESILLASKEIDWPAQSGEVMLWAEVFLPSSESKVRHRLGARGPVLVSNGILLHVSKKEDAARAAGTQQDGGWHGLLVKPCS